MSRRLAGDPAGYYDGLIAIAGGKDAAGREGRRARAALLYNPFDSIAGVGVLAAIAVPNFLNFREKAKRAAGGGAGAGDGSIGKPPPAGGQDAPRLEDGGCDDGQPCIRDDGGDSGEPRGSLGRGSPGEGGAALGDLPAPPLDAGGDEVDDRPVLLGAAAADGGSACRRRNAPASPGRSCRSPSACARCPRRRS